MSDRESREHAALELIHCYETIFRSQNTWAIAAAREELPKLRERFREVFPEFVETEPEQCKTE